MSKASFTSSGSSSASAESKGDALKRHPRGALASASSYLDITPLMLEAGVAELVASYPEDEGYEVVASRVYRAMQKARNSCPNKNGSRT